MGQEGALNRLEAHFTLSESHHVPCSNSNGSIWTFHTFHLYDVLQFTFFSTFAPNSNS